MDVTTLEQAVKKAADGDLKTRIDENRAETEMRPLVQQVNRLIARAADTAEKKHRADTMIKFNPLAIAILKKDRAIVNINKKYESLWRGTRDELMKKRLYDFDITVISGDHVYACFETRKLAVSECRVKWPDGTQKYLTLQAMPLLDAVGEVDGAFYFWIDTTDSTTRLPRPSRSSNGPTALSRRTRMHSSPSTRTLPSARRTMRS